MIAVKPPPTSPYRRPRVLQLAYCCDPYRGSEEGVGWNVAFEVAKHCDTWVICEEMKYAKSIRKFETEHGPIPGLQFVFVPEEFWAHAMWATGLGYVSYNLWHRRVLKVARDLHSLINFDLIHQVNIIGFREPGYLWKLGPPFVWGPVGGLQDYPFRFLAEAGAAAAARELVRTAFNRMQWRFSPRVRKAANTAAALLAANSDAKRLLSQISGATPILLSEVCTREVGVQRPVQKAPEGVFRILWSGTFHPRKALSILLRALARIQHEINFKLRVVGDGPQRKRWYRLAGQLGINDRISWIGRLPHDLAVAQFSWADVMVFTSLRDTTGTVVVESLASGTPVVCLDHQGAGDVVDETCGFKIPVSDRHQVVIDLGEALLRMANSPEDCGRLRRGAVLRAAYFSGHRQGRRILTVYRRLLDDKHLQTSPMMPKPWIPGNATDVEP